MKTLITKHGQVSIPTKLQQEKTGKLPAIKADLLEAIGFAKRHGFPQKTTTEWMTELREAEQE